MRLKSYNIVLAIIFAGGLILRFGGLNKPLWIDEVLFASYVKNGAAQEFIPLVIGRFMVWLDLTGDFWLRMPFAVASSATIIAVYFAIKDKTAAIVASAVFAFLPLFVFWGALARPYAMAGLFVALAWQSRLFMIPALFCTPFAILGLPVVKRMRLWQAAALIVLAGILFAIRPDSGRDFINWSFITGEKRLWYIPLLSALLHGGYYSWKRQLWSACEI